MKLTSEQKLKNSRARMLEKANSMGTRKYINNFVAPLFQKMIRAEAGADKRRFVPAVVNGDILSVEREIGQCVCVTCGTVKAWDSGIKGMHCGHFLASRCNSILFEEENTAPQCSHCNYYRSGEQQLFRKWMISVRGQEAVERLERLKPQSKTFTREELVDMRIATQARLDAAIMLMKRREQ